MTYKPKDIFDRPAVIHCGAPLICQFLAKKHAFWRKRVLKNFIASTVLVSEYFWKSGLMDSRNLDPVEQLYESKLKRKLEDTDINQPF